MDFITIKTEQDGGAFVITLNRPDRRNAVSVQAMDELIAAARIAESDSSVFGVIITGGDQFFSAGADLNDALAISSSSEGVEYFNRWHRLTTTLEGLAKPVLAAIEGFCVTGGCELVLACDIRVAGEGSTFGITSSKIGTVPGAGGTQRLPRVVGAAKALEILFSADTIDAAEAYRIGLINRLVPKGGSLAEAKSMVAVYTQRAPLSLAWNKRAVYTGLQMDLKSGLELESFLVTAIYGTSDRKEGISAFLEKRKATFTGK
ncbi:MAG: enoyl-CoA hydratase/isomerase family protein [Proteobacteria bacterium]|nr:enoyl-CoA hydratase/isomerase family protein [Pseudomonadota bacterium]